jgi:hypothetical protein
MAVAAAVILPASAAGASPPPVFWVSSGGTPAHADVSCPTAGYSTIQAAVTAAEVYEGLHPVVGIDLFNADPTCTKSVTTPTSDVACYNVIRNSHGYPGGKPSADANVTGWTSTPPVVGYQAGVSDTGDHDVICDNATFGAGYAPLDATSSLPKPPPPAFVRPVDIMSIPAIAPVVYGNTFDWLPYHPA